MKTFTRTLRLLSLAIVPLALGACRGEIASDLAGDGTETSSKMASGDVSATDPAGFDPYYVEDLLDGLWYYAAAPVTEVAART